MIKSRVIQVALLVVLALLSSRAAHAQRQRQPPARPFTAAPMIDEQANRVEAEIGRLMQRRSDHSAGPPPRELELRIDVRLVARWLLARAVDAPAGSDAQASAWIRAGDVLIAAMLVENELDAGASRAAGASKAAALKALHDLTFKLTDAKSAPDPNAASRAVAAALMAALGAEAGDLVRLPLMRPPVRAADLASQPSDDGSPRTIEQLFARARELPVSVPLRAQLVAMSQAAQAAAQDPKRGEDAADFRKVLDEAVTLAEGLGANTAVEREDRVKMEAQVAQGLAMCLDPRTRALGQRRVTSLGKYRQMLKRLDGLRLSPDLLRRFSPALTAARTADAESGARLMSALELFVQQDARLSALSTSKSSELPAPYAKAADEARRRAMLARESFLEAASSRNADVLAAHAEMMRKALDAAAVIARTPAALKALTALRPKPYGGIDKRVQGALAAWTADATDAARDASSEFLSQLTRLADLAEQLNHPTTAPKNEEAYRHYTGGDLTAFHEARKSAVAALADAVAGGGAIDNASFAPLDTANVLLAGMEQGMRAEAALANAEALRRWVDWGVDAEPLEAVISPYRKSTAAAIAGYSQGERFALERWDAERKRYEPLLALLSRVGDRAGECSALPSGRTGALARLVTPLVDQPYARERATRLALDAWSHFRRAHDDKSAAAALDALAARLSK